MLRFIKFRFLKIFFFSMFIVLGCANDNGSEGEAMNESFFDVYQTRQFKMGFTTWPYAPTQEAVTSTAAFLAANGDIYSEHIDSEIPWNAWINDTALPSSFTEMIANRATRRTSTNTMTLSISLLNLGRDDLMADIDGSVPTYSSLDDAHIAAAYYKHVNYLVSELTPSYLVIAVEVDGILRNSPEKWDGYLSLIADVKGRIKTDYPTLPISESVTLHGFYEPDFGDPQDVISTITSYINTMDFASISFYPFLKGLHNKASFQAAFDFLHDKVNKPIAFAETGQLSEDLAIEGFDLFIEGNQLEQKDYLETLLINAQEEEYEYVVWWTHRDYDLLWDIFPEELKDVGEIWISNGILNEDGAEKDAYASWQKAFSK